MGLLDSVLAALPGAPDAHGDALRAIVATLAEHGHDDASPGDLSGLMERLREGGLAEVVASWLGGGRNLPVSAAQLHAALGGDWIARFARQLGLAPEAAAGELALTLPDMIDRLTPDGELPDVGSSGFGDLGSVLERFSRA